MLYTFFQQCDLICDGVNREVFAKDLLIELHYWGGKMATLSLSKHWAFLVLIFLQYLIL